MKKKVIRAKIDVPAVVLQVEHAFYEFIFNADGACLLHLARGDGIGVKIVGLKAPEIRLLGGQFTCSPRESGEIDLYLESPIHSLPIETELSPFDFVGCVRWLREHDLDSSIFDNFDPSYKSNSEMIRLVQESLFTNDDLLDILRLEMADEVSDIVFEAGVELEFLVEEGA